MCEIKKSEYTPNNIIAGDFPVGTDFGPVKSGATIRQNAPVVRTVNGVEEFTADMLPTAAPGETEATGGMLDSLVGIAADNGVNGGTVVYYLTGEYFSDALVLPKGVTADALKPTFRKLGIFLKEMK